MEDVREYMQRVQSPISGVEPSPDGSTPCLPKTFPRAVQALGEEFAGKLVSARERLK